MFIFFLYFSMLMIFLSLFSQMKHLFMSFLYIETIMLLIIMMSMMSFSMTSQFNMFFLMFFLILSVCEVSISLSLLVLMTRSYGSDLISTLSLNKC
uniref:NADH dehydrogenase subunit 4L n=1 Tax=Oligobrachia dogieli TaxID=3095170 RepID=UPI002E786B11|nr:NADH dehydrogenase subunit 4L [Oligobrachia dogieli]WPV72832.1 NADH dehydrogenase subunit 4L [Oligobrachia dogieli]